MTKGLEVIRDFDTLYNEAYYAWDPFYPLAERDLRFFLGDQWDEQEKRKLFEEGRSTFVFNRVRRNINMVTGYQRKNRHSSIVLPWEMSDESPAEDISTALQLVMRKADAYQVISDAFGGACKTGWNLLHPWMDYRDDPVNGDIKIERIPYNGFITDPYFTKLDFSDCGYVLMRKYLTFDQVLSLLPNKKKDIKQLYKFGWERDDKFTWLPYQRQPNGEDLMAFSEMYRQKWRDVPVIVDQETGEWMEFDVDDERVDVFLSQFPQMEVVKKPKQYIVKDVIVNDAWVGTEENPFGLDEYPFTPTIGIWEPESDQWGLKVQSLIRCQIDPQRESNRRRSQMVDLLDSQINSGWIADENSVINPRSLFQSSQGKVIWRREDTRPGAVEKIQPAQIPPSMFQLQELFDKDMVEILGVNDAAFGMAEHAEESGVLMMLRQGAALVNLQDVFDNLRHSQKNLSQKIIKMMLTWTPNKFKRLLGRDVDPKIFENDFSKYDIQVAEGLLTDTQRQMYFRQMVELRQMGAPITGEYLTKIAPIQGKKEAVEYIGEIEKQQAEQAQRDKEVQNQLLETQSQMAQARAISDVALSKERFTRAVANMGLEDERASEAIQNRSQATLDRVRAIKEIQLMDDDRLMKYLGVIMQMEEMSRQKEQETKSDDIEVSQSYGTANPGQEPVQQQGAIL